jgi:putative phage-type endonuclease
LNEHLIQDKDEWLELRSRNINSTEVAGLFGLSPYITEFELWFHKAEKSSREIEDNERMQWGRMLESVIAQKFADDNGLSGSVHPVDVYLEKPMLRVGSSFDFFVGEDGILEIKNVDGLVFRNNWEDGRPPIHIQIQVQHQLWVSDRSFAWVVALVGGNRLVSSYIKRNDAMIKKLEIACARFWDSVDNNTPPAPNFEVDSDFIIQQYNQVSDGEVIGSTEEIDDLAQEYMEASRQIKQFEKKKQEAKAKILMLINDAHQVLGNGYKISAGMTKESVVKEYIRKPTRTFRVTQAKDK